MNNIRGTILIIRTDSIREMLVKVQGDSVIEEIKSIREAAEYLKVSVPTIRSMVANITFFQRGQAIRINRWDVKEWLCNSSKH
ncbi:helix-turn-helix domain-containing protein [Sutcliffiella horikoshii]|uniref:helix-turn-helix domain-containing protein n=1 Tax=Sutcliffiella horikoshii TaxID=79883 RepID=UPI00384DD005